MAAAPRHRLACRRGRRYSGSTYTQCRRLCEYVLRRRHIAAVRGVLDRSVSERSSTVGGRCRPGTEEVLTFKGRERRQLSRSGTRRQLLQLPEPDCRRNNQLQQGAESRTSRRWQSRSSCGLTTPAPGARCNRTCSPTPIKLGTTVIVRVLARTDRPGDDITVQGAFLNAPAAALTIRGSAARPAPPRTAARFAPQDELDEFHPVCMHCRHWRGGDAANFGDDMKPTQMIMTAARPTAARSSRVWPTSRRPRACSSRFTTQRCRQKNTCLRSKLAEQDAA